MKILLLTDVPPCTNYTAGMVLAQIVKLLPRGSVACFCILNPDLQNIDPDPQLAWMPLEYASKPRETGYPPGVRLRELRSYCVERVRQAAATPTLSNLVADFAARQGVDTIWAALQGQTMVRLAGRVADRLKMPLFTHVWDPLQWWLNANAVDRRSARAAQAEFDATIRRSVAVATASPAMSADFAQRYNVRSVALIACHDRRTARKPPPHPHRDGELVIGMAGQFYANVEWQTLVRALNGVDWNVAGRQVSLLVLGHYVPESPIPEGRSTFLGWQSQADTIRILAEQADVLYCPYPFDPSMAEVVRLSFPSKLVSYFAAGRPVLLHAPVTSSPATYVTERVAGLVTLGGGVSNVYNALHILASEPDRYTALALGAQQAFESDFTLEQMRERVFEFLNTDEANLANCPPAPLPFDPNSAAARLPPPRTNLPPLRGALHLLLTQVRRTPLAPLANAFVRVVRAFIRWWRQRPRVVLAQQRDAMNAIVHHLNTERAAESQRLLAVEATAAKLERERDEYANAVTQSEARRREFEVSIAVLKEQLNGASSAYTRLAETHAALNRRFDAVASSALGKISLLEQHQQQLLDQTRIAANGHEDRSQYLDLLETVLTGTAFADPSNSPWAAPGYSADTRLLGRDWPAQALTMIGTVRMRNIRVLLEGLLRDNILGDLVETGVWRGGACLYMRAILAANGVTDRTVWLADSFRGLPEPNAAEFPADAGDTHHSHTELAVSSDQVRASFARFGLLDGQVRFLEGWFKDTLPSAPIDRVALLRLDGDMYKSTWQALDALYHKVSPGGFVIVDDYILEACAKAVDEWRKQHDIDAPLHEVDGAAVYWRKP